MPTAPTESEPLALSLPATSANLGSGFDAAALALSLHLEVRAQVAREFRITAAGRDAEICSRLERHLILEVYRAAIAAFGQRPQPLALHIENEIPIGKGCGSSAAARVAGLMLAAHFGHLPWTGEELLAEAARLEGHADNAAACWRGGLVATKAAGASGEITTVSLPLACSWPLLLVVPAEALATAESRSALPGSYTRADAVANVQSALFLAAAFTQGRGDLLRFGFDDRLHQPYRERLCPCLAALRPLVDGAGILGIALSGAGPSVLLVLASDADREAARAAVRQRLRHSGLEAELIDAEVEARGAGAGFRPSGAKARA